MAGVPVSIAAKVYGKDPSWVRAGLLYGWLPIGYATRDGQIVTETKQGQRTNYYISPSKLYNDTGYWWKGEKSVNNYSPRTKREK